MGGQQSKQQLMVTLVFVVVLATMSVQRTKEKGRDGDRNFTWKTIETISSVEPSYELDYLLVHLIYKRVTPADPASI